MAPDSKTETGLSPPLGAVSTIAGMRLFGAIFRKSGANCAPAPMSTGLRT
jgi:hypothetical protein